MGATRYAAVAAVCAGLAAAALAAEEPTLIRGFFWQQEPQRPVPGAFAALYEASTNMFLDAAYTTDTGAFTLRAPASGGRFLVVVTKGSMVARAELAFAAGQPAPAVTISWREPPAGLGQKIQGLWDKFGAWITGILGFLLGLLKRLWDDRQAFRREINRLRFPRDQLLTAYHNMKDVLLRKRSMRADDPDHDALRLQYSGILAAMAAPLAELEAARVEASVIHAARKAAGLKDYYDFRLAIQSAKELVERDHGALLLLGEQQQAVRLAPFDHIDKNALFRT